MSPGVPEILIIALVILLFFGAKRIPELARGIGKGISEFRKASDDIKKEIERGEQQNFASEERSKEKSDKTN
ncbi:MAG: twin-arginine translocase TatA/TatE family subunit [Balneolaceae bacterium]|nr:twin-arginine translocase TatA/TatE family subunit [Balneolaceae bacterium]